jgi:plastocyanin
MDRIRSLFSRALLSSAMCIVSLGALLMATSCGGSSGPSTGPSPVTVISRSTGSVGTIGATITITGSGVSPSSVTISAGQSVTFVNSDNRSHEIASDPHPQHGFCPSIEAGLGLISPGQTKSTLGFADVGTCGFHDHQDATNRSLQGTIRIQ